MAELSSSWSPTLTMSKIMDKLRECLYLTEPNLCSPCIGGGEVDCRLCENYIAPMQLPKVIAYLYRENFPSKESELVHSISELIVRYANIQKQHCNAYSLWKQDKKLYAQIAKEWTTRYAT